MRSLLFKSSLLFVILGSVLLISGCNLEDYMYGTVTYDGMTDGDDVHVILDNNNDPDDGNVAFVTVTASGSGKTIAYVLETIDIPDGSYYLMAGYDSGMDGPEDIANWDSYQWYGGTAAAPPAFPNIQVFYGQYNIVLPPTIPLP